MDDLRLHVRHRADDMERGHCHPRRIARRADPTGVHGDLTLPRRLRHGALQLAGHPDHIPLAVEFGQQLYYVSRQPAAR